MCFLTSAVVVLTSWQPFAFSAWEVFVLQTKGCAANGACWQQLMGQSGGMGVNGCHRCQEEGCLVGLGGREQPRCSIPTSKSPSRGAPGAQQQWELLSRGHSKRWGGICGSVRWRWSCCVCSWPRCCSVLRAVLTALAVWSSRCSGALGPNHACDVCAGLLEDLVKRAEVLPLHRDPLLSSLRGGILHIPRPGHHPASV